MKLILQPKGSKVCGHCSIAMITDRPLIEIIKVIGHTNGTTTKEVSTVLNSYGVKCKNKLSRLTFGKKLPYFCLIKLTNYDGSGHWSVKEGDLVYCPGLGIYNLKSVRPRGGMHITSYLELNGKD